MDYTVSELDIWTILARLDDIPEEQRLESGVSASAVMTLIDEVKAAATEVRGGRLEFGNYPTLSFSSLTGDFVQLSGNP